MGRVMYGSASYGSEGIYCCEIPMPCTEHVSREGLARIICRRSYHETLRPSNPGGSLPYTDKDTCKMFFIERCLPRCTTRFPERERSCKVTAPSKRTFTPEAVSVCPVLMFIRKVSSNGMSDSFMCQTPPRIDLRHGRAEYTTSTFFRRDSLPFRVVGNCLRPFSE